MFKLSLNDKQRVGSIHSYFIQTRQHLALIYITEDDVRRGETTGLFFTEHSTFLKLLCYGAETDAPISLTGKSSSGRVTICPILAWIVLDFRGSPVKVKKRVLGTEAQLQEL